MLKIRRAMAVVAVLLLVVCTVFLGMQLSRWIGGGPRVHDTAVLVKQIQTLSQLVTVQYVMEKVMVVEVPPESTLGMMFAGDNRVLLLAHGIIKAGIDLGALKPEDLQVNGKSVCLRLPPAAVTDAYLDEKQTQVIERKTGFLRSFDKDLEQDVRRTALTDLRLAALRGGIRQDAEQRARAQLTNFFRQLGFEKIEFRPAARDAAAEQE